MALHRFHHRKGGTRKSCHPTPDSDFVATSELHLTWPEPLSLFGQETQVLICSLSSSRSQINCVGTEHLSLYVVMFESIFETIDSWLTSVSQSLTSLQEPDEPLQSKETLKKDMDGLLSFLKLPLSYGHQELKNHWPHTPDEANLVIQCLHDLARALFGARKDDAVVASFLEKRGLSMLAEAIVEESTPEMIRAQTWQSLCLILLNVEDSFVRHRGTHSQTCRKMRSNAYCFDMQSRLSDTMPHLMHVRCCPAIPGMKKTAGGCLPTVDDWARAGCVVVW